MSQDILKNMLDRFRQADQPQGSKEKSTDRESKDNRNSAIESILQTISAYFECYDSLYEQNRCFDIFGSAIKVERDNNGYPVFKNGFVSESLLP